MARGSESQLAAGGGHGVRKTSFKRARRSRFRARGDDQIRKDLEKAGQAREEDANGRAIGPVGTINKVALDEDIPGSGKFYCNVCARYFATNQAYLSHLKTKKHKRRYKLFYEGKSGALRKEGDIFHSQMDAERAKGRGGTDNGTPVARMSATATVASQEEAQDPIDFGEL